MIVLLENTIKEQEKYLEKLKVKSCKVKMLFSQLEQCPGAIHKILRERKKQKIKSPQGKDTA